MYQTQAISMSYFQQKKKKKNIVRTILTLLFGVIATNVRGQIQ